jgi:microcompartment protein CcmL/EutN
MTPGPALALLEFGSIAAGIEAGDAMVKRATLDVTMAGTVQPGHYLVLVAGDTASVEEAVDAGRSAGTAALVDEVMLADIHPEVLAAVGGRRAEPSGEALGVVETSSSAALVDAADAGVKASGTLLGSLRLADGLGGKAYVLFHGAVADVEVAVAAATDRAARHDAGVAASVIPQLHEEMLANLVAGPRFGERVEPLGRDGS